MRKADIKLLRPECPLGARSGHYLSCDEEKGERPFDRGYRTSPKPHWERLAGRIWPVASLYHESKYTMEENRIKHNESR